ncbi:DnaD domain protein [Fructilactobacillus vespulae]|uniref:DnaD domain-containing protein n=1 Tax=Fructilactobacillus vespulae TaxID=1249630 RepID=UPI0039B5CBF7
MVNTLENYFEMGSINVSGALLSNMKQLNLNSDELVVVLELKYFRSMGNKFPTPDELSEKTGINVDKMYEILHQLVLKKIIYIDNDSSSDDEYSFKPLIAKLNQILENQVTQKIDVSNSFSVKEDNVKQRQDIFNEISKEFGRMLSPIELETISEWFDSDKYSPNLVSLALKEAVLNQVYNLKYMDRILLNWKKQNITSAVQVEKQHNQYIKKDQNSYSNQNLPKVPMFKIKKE